MDSLVSHTLLQLNTWSFVIAVAMPVPGTQHRLCSDQSSSGAAVKLSTVGGRAFPVAGPTIWNSLPDSVISAPSLPTFRQRLKTFLFQASFPDIITDPQ